MHEERLYQIILGEYERKRNQADSYYEDDGYKEDISQLNPDGYGYAYETHLD